VQKAQRSVAAAQQLMQQGVYKGGTVKFCYSPASQQQVHKIEKAKQWLSSLEM